MPNCSEGCAKINGKDTCFCAPGYQLSMDNITYMYKIDCISDIDECNIPGTCNHNCTNTDGSFTCSCNNGYKLDDNGRSCNGMYIC